MKEINFGNDSELVINYIDPDAMLTHYLNWHRHKGHENWIAEYHMKSDPSAPILFGGKWYIETAIVGDGERLTHMQALQIVHEYESRIDPETPSMDPVGPDETHKWRYERGDLFEEHLRRRWHKLGPSPGYPEEIENWRQWIEENSESYGGKEHKKELIKDYENRYGAWQGDV